MKKVLVSILSIVLCISLVSGGAVFSASTVPATNTDAVITEKTDATPFRISVVVNGDASTSKGITWYTKANTSSVVNIFDENGAKVNAKVDCADVFEFEGNYVHKATVTGLEAGKTYLYEVGNGKVFSAAGKFVSFTASKSTSPQSLPS